jgi:hypothetical protein
MPLQQPIILFPQNDQTITWGPLILGSTQFSSSPTYIVDGVGTLTVNDPNGNPITGATNLNFSFVASSNGLYTVFIAGASFNPTPTTLLPFPWNCSSIIAFTSAAQSASNKWTIPTKIQLRNSS